MGFSLTLLTAIRRGIRSQLYCSENYSGSAAGSGVGRGSKVTCARVAPDGAPGCGPTVRVGAGRSSRLRVPGMPPDGGAPDTRSPVGYARSPAGPARRRRATRRYRAPRYVFFEWDAAHPACTRACRSHRFPRRVRPVRRFPALSLLPGHIPAQLAHRPAVGNGSTVGPISASSTSAVCFWIPGIVVSRFSASTSGAVSWAIRASSWATSRSS